MNERPTNEQVLMQAAQGFLQRTELKGGEVDTYAKCFNFIQSIVEGKNVVIPAGLFHEGQDAIQAMLAQVKEEEGQKIAEDVPVEGKDTSNGDDMISQGGPLQETPAAELEEV